MPEVHHSKEADTVTHGLQKPETAKVSDFPELGIRGLQRLARGRLSGVKGNSKKGIPGLTKEQLEEQLEPFDFPLAEIKEAITWQEEQTAKSKQSKQTQKKNG